MRYAIALLLLLAFVASVSAAQFQKVDWYVSDRSYDEPSTVFFNSYTGVGDLATNVWHEVDLHELHGIPRTAVSAMISGILIITQGTTLATAGMTLAFRKSGDTSVNCNMIIAQAIEGPGNGGIRSTMSAFIPLIDGKFEWCWTRQTTLQWPSSAAYGLNLHMQGYAVPQ